jgi:O-antigen ligase
MALFKPDTKTTVYANLMLLLAFSIPLHKTFSSLVIMLMVIFWLIESSPKTKFRKLIQPARSGYIIGFSAIYLFYVIGIFYSDAGFEIPQSRFILQVKASLLIFPLIFATVELERFDQRHLNRILIFFIAGCLASTLIILGNATYTFYSTDHTVDVFFYARLAKYHHPSYLSLIYAFAVAFLLTRFLRDQNITRSKTILNITLIIYFQVFISLLSSKAGIIGLFFLWGGVVIFILLKLKNRRWRAVYFSAAMALIFILLLLMNPTVIVRFKAAEKAMTEDYKSDSETLDGSVARILIWRSALEIISEKPVFGVGTGDVRDELVRKYRENNITPAIENEYNAHNQYLQTYLATGIAGLLSLMGSLALAFVVAFRSGNLLYFLFAVLFSFHIMVESMLDRQAGVVFYAFFNALLFYFALLQKKQSNLQLP